MAGVGICPLWLISGSQQFNNPLAEVLAGVQLAVMSCRSWHARAGGTGTREERGLRDEGPGRAEGV